MKCLECNWNSPRSHPHLPESTNTACKVTVRDVSLLPDKDGTLNKLNVSILNIYLLHLPSFTQCMPLTLPYHGWSTGMDLVGGTGGTLIQPEVPSERPTATVDPLDPPTGREGLLRLLETHGAWPLNRLKHGWQWPRDQSAQRPRDQGLTDGGQGWVPLHSSLAFARPLTPTHEKVGQLRCRVSRPVRCSPVFSTHSRLPGSPTLTSCLGCLADTLVRHEGHSIRAHPCAVVTSP